MKTIHKLLREKQGNIKTFSDFCGINRDSLNYILTKKLKDSTKTKYTKLYNDCFNTTYSVDDLF